MEYLLDTNALSEAAKPQPDSGFISWLKGADDVSLYTSCLVVGEIQKGIALLNEAKRRSQIQGWLNQLIADFDGRILEINEDVCLLWGKLLADARLSGKTAPLIDALIAAQCIHYKLTLVTRNKKDFEQFEGLEVFCPWSN